MVTIKADWDDDNDKNIFQDEKMITPKKCVVDDEDGEDIVTSLIIYQG